jgi:hypothetical protein
MVTKYYRDAGGNYIGSFSGDTGAVPDGAIEVLNPPLNGLATVERFELE